MTEPLLANAGIVLPKPGYLKGVERLCAKYNVLWVDDEIQAGLGRTGKLLMAEHENARPDIVCLGKSLSGGTIPVSCTTRENLIRHPIKSISTSLFIQTHILRCQQF